MSAPLASVVPAVAESLDALEAHQQILLGQLRAIHTRLSLGAEDEDELLPTLTYYINQASYVQRKIMLIHGRVSDMKRRAERLKAHRAKQDQSVAEWMAQERARQVPVAQASPALAQAVGSTARLGMVSPDASDRMSLQSAAEGDESGMAAVELPASLATTGGLGIDSPASLAAPEAGAMLPVTTIKRKGKRRVRMTTIE
ncbi:hypothetical protein GGI20_005178 [Coemansia sp. BCRC 34301]|nr:hypothetical protein GGI20_005178 [Coemansia sp. BCRC 34301]